MNAVTKAESLLAYFQGQRKHWREKLQAATLGCDQDTALMWVKHYDRMCDLFPSVSQKAA